MVVTPGDEVMVRSQVVLCTRSTLGSWGVKLALGREPGVQGAGVLVSGRPRAQL